MWATTDYGTPHIKDFCKKGILHIIPSTDNSIFYKLKAPFLKPDKLHTGNPHFICNNWRSTFCLDTRPTPKIKLLEVYTSIEIVVNGMFNRCA